MRAGARGAPAQPARRRDARAALRPRTAGRHSPVSRYARALPQLCSARDHGPATTASPTMTTPACPPPRRHHDHRDQHDHGAQPPPRLPTPIPTSSAAPPPRRPTTPPRSAATWSSSPSCATSRRRSAAPAQPVWCISFRLLPPSVRTPRQGLPGPTRTAGGRGRPLAGRRQHTPATLLFGEALAISRSLGLAT